MALANQPVWPAQGGIRMAGIQYSCASNHGVSPPSFWPDLSTFEPAIAIPGVSPVFWLVYVEEICPHCAGLYDTDAMEASHVELGYQGLLQLSDMMKRKINGEIFRHGGRVLHVKNEIAMDV